MSCNCIEQLAEDAVRKAINKIAEELVDQDIRRCGSNSPLWVAVYDRSKEVLSEDRVILKKIKEKLIKGIEGIR